MQDLRSPASPGPDTPRAVELKGVLGAADGLEDGAQVIRAPQAPSQAPPLPSPQNARLRTGPLRSAFLPPPRAPGGPDPLPSPTLHPVLLSPPPLCLEGQGHPQITDLGASPGGPSLSTWPCGESPTCSSPRAASLRPAHSRLPWSYCIHREAVAYEAPFLRRHCPGPPPAHPALAPLLSSPLFPSAAQDGSPSVGDTGPSVKDPIAPQGGIQGTKGPNTFIPHSIWSVPKRPTRQAPQGPRSPCVVLGAKLWVMGMGIPGSLEQPPDPRVTPASQPPHLSGIAPQDT